MNNFLIDIEKENVDLYVNDKTLNFFTKDIELLIFTFIFMLISFIISTLQYYGYEPLIQLKKYIRIKKNFNNWKNIIQEKSKIESNVNRQLFLKTNNSKLNTFNCYDIGGYYIAAMLDNVSYLPTFIQRGNGDVWKIKKSDEKDISAKQYCDYIISKYNNKTITCGTDMYMKLGYGGYFNNDHPCQSITNIFDKIYN